MNRQEFLEATLSKLREKTGVFESNWSNWFSGKSSPKLDTLREIASSLDLGLIELVEAFEERRSRTMRKP